MKGTTKFLTYSGDVINRCPQAIQLNNSDVIQLELAPEGKPTITSYRVEKTEIKIDFRGYVHYEYTVNQVSDTIKQQFFIQ